MSKLLTHELYTAVTGKAWTKGAGGQTDGSYAANFALRKDLLAAYRKMSKEEMAAKAVAANTTTTSTKATSEPVTKAKEEKATPVKKVIDQVKAPISDDIKKSQEARAKAVDLRAKGEALIRESKKVADAPIKHNLDKQTINAKKYDSTMDRIMPALNTTRDRIREFTQAYNDKSITAEDFNRKYFNKSGRPSDINYNVNIDAMDPDLIRMKSAGLPSKPAVKPKPKKK
jgi:hypothetical protein